jgi:hypothetical protein
VRGLLVAVVGGLGFGAFWRRRRRKPIFEGWPGEVDGDPAGELRAKLAESKLADTPGSESEAAGPAADARPHDPVSPLDPEVRRRNVHERARSSLDELK